MFLKKKLYPFQETGALFLARTPHALLADEMGLGKTVQAIAAAEMIGSRRTLVVCPASVRLNWAQEIEECVGGVNGWDIISYNKAVAIHANSGAYQKYDTLICDEAHFLKTMESQRTRALFMNNTGIARFADRKWMLTGTPVLNRPRELYPMLKVLASDKIAPYDNFTAFTQRYCGAFFDGYGMNTRGATNLKDLSERLKGFMLRRTKKEVAPELPLKVISRVPLEIEVEDLHEVIEAEQAISNREEYISSVHESYSQLGDLAQLLRLTGEAKVRAAVFFVKELLNTVDKVVVFTRHREVLSRYAALFGSYAVSYQGGMNDVQKKKAIRNFVKDPNTKIFLGNISAAGVGINGLQEVCSTVVFAELSWVPGEMAQAIDRCHRHGQTAQQVNVYILHAPGTLESAVLGVQTGKISVIKQLIGD